MKLILIKQLNNTFKVAYPSDYDNLKKLKAGEFLECEIRMPRNVGFHRKFFALINMVYQNQSTYNNIEHLRRDLIIEAGFYEEWADFNGEVKRRAKSISFSSMGEDEFQELYDRVLDVIVDVYKFEKQDIVESLAEFM